MLLDGKILKIFPLSTTRMGKEKRKFVLGFGADKNYAIIVSTVGELSEKLNKFKEFDNVQVLASLHTAVWKDGEEINRAFELRAIELKIKKNEQTPK